MSPVSAAERRKHWQNVLDRQAASGKPSASSAPKKTSQFRPSICGAKSYRTTKRRQYHLARQDRTVWPRIHPPAAASRSTLDPQWILAAVRCIDPC